jgi:hypothetical protein
MSGDYPLLRCTGMQLRPTEGRMDKVIVAALLLFMLWVLAASAALTLPAVMVLQHSTMVLGGAQ